MIGCGIVYGVVEIALDEKIEHDASEIEVFKRIKTLMETRGVTEFYLKFMSKNVQYFASSGSKVGQTSTGTLGGFALAVNNENLPLNNEQYRAEANLVALFSRHVAIFQENNALFFNGRHIADILDTSKLTSLDIAAARILPDHRTTCQQRFLTEDEEEARCTLLRDFTNLVGEVVHIWGAVSKPGLGRIQACEYNWAGDDKNDSGYEVVITDRINNRCFSQPGDSGSVVCKMSRRGRILNAVAMFCGQRCNLASGNENRYCSLQLDYGIRKLGEAHQLYIEWLSDSE